MRFLTTIKGNPDTQSIHGTSAEKVSNAGVNIVTGYFNGDIPSASFTDHNATIILQLPHHLFHRNLNNLSSSPVLLGKSLDYNFYLIVPTLFG